MGSNHTQDVEEKLRIGATVHALKSHPNFESKIPLDGESEIQFTLRCIAHLVSPPMVEDEDNEMACTDLRDAILGMKEEIEKSWKNRKIKKQ